MPQVHFILSFENAAILTLDGVGEWTTASVGIGKGDGSESYKRN